MRRATIRTLAEACEFVVRARNECVREASGPCRLWLAFTPSPGAARPKEGATLYVVGEEENPALGAQIVELDRRHGWIPMDRTDEQIRYAAREAFYRLPILAVQP